MLSALVPIKGYSKRVPNKNFRMLTDKPLYKHILNTLSKSKLIDEIYIDTDVKDKFDLSDYNNVQIIDRPEELMGDMVPVNALIQHDLTIVKADIILQTHTTNPFLTVKTVDKCIKKFQDERLDSLFTVTPHYKRFWNGECEPINHNPNELLRSQDLPPLYEDNSCVYLFTRDFFGKYGVRMNKKSKMFILNEKEETIDIDTNFDWRVAECLAERLL